MNTFREWFKENLAEQASDIANHGADCGFPHITYTNECAQLFDRFGSEIWEMAVEDADDFGHDNVAQMIASFKRSDMLGDLNQFKNLMVWYACEKIAREMTDANEEAA